MDSPLSFGEMNRQHYGDENHLMNLDLSLLIPLLEILIPLLSSRKEPIHFGKRANNRKHNIESSLPSFGVEEG